MMYACNTVRQGPGMPPACARVWREPLPRVRCACSLARARAHARACELHHGCCGDADAVLRCCVLPGLVVDAHGVQEGACVCVWGGTQPIVSEPTDTVRRYLLQGSTCQRYRYLGKHLVHTHDKCCPGVPLAHADLGTSGMHYVHVCMPVPGMPLLPCAFNGSMHGHVSHMPHADCHLSCMCRICSMSRRHALQAACMWVPINARRADNSA